MKYLLLVTVLFSSFAADAQMEIKYPRQNPISLVIVNHSEVASFVYDLTNAQGEVRMRVDFNGGADYYYTNGSNYSDIIHLAPAEGKDLRLLVNNASHLCPLSVTLDRDSFKILKMSSPCDPMGIGQ